MQSLKVLEVLCDFVNTAERIIIKPMLRKLAVEWCTAIDFLYSPQRDSCD